MRDYSKNQVTKLLKRMNEGDKDARDELFTFVYKDLHERAKSVIKRGRPESIYQTTQLLHDAYFKLVHKSNQNCVNRNHFFSVAFLAMRQVLQEMRRKLKAKKRGGDWHRVPLEDGPITYNEEFSQPPNVRDALAKLNEEKRVWGEVAALHILDGLTMEEIAKRLNMPLDSVKDKWRVARAWLKRELNDQNPHDP